MDKRAENCHSENIQYNLSIVDIQGSFQKYPFLVGFRFFGMKSLSRLLKCISFYFCRLYCMESCESQLLSSVTEESFNFGDSFLK
jgi:hypothetical protein